MTQELPNFLKEMLFENYGEKITNKIINGYKKQEKTTLRINALKQNAEKIKQELEKEKIIYMEVPWYEDALILENAKEEEIKNLNIYKNGEIYLQSLSSMIPPLILEPKAGENILDMTAAPRRKNYTNCSTFQKRSHDNSL